MDFLTTNEMSELWKISARRISLLCSEGRIEGAVKKGKTWLIPKDAKKPVYPRRVNNKQNDIKRQEQKKVKPCDTWEVK